MATQECVQARKAVHLMTRMRDSFTHSPGDSDSEKGSLSKESRASLKGEIPTMQSSAENSQGAHCALQAKTGNTGMGSSPSLANNSLIRKRVHLRANGDSRPINGALWPLPGTSTQPTPHKSTHATKQVPAMKTAHANVAIT